MEYTDQWQDDYEEHYRQRVMCHLTKRAELLGFQFARFGRRLERPLPFSYLGCVS
jgi:hypothetical protein